MILTKKLQKLSGKTDKYELLQTKKYYLLTKVEWWNKLCLLICLYKKQIKTIEDQGKKQVTTWKVLKLDTQLLSIKNEIPEDKLNEEAKNEIEKSKEIKKKQIEQI